MAKQETTKEVATRKTAPPPAAYQERRSVVDSSDIIVPKLLLAQGLSQSVADGKAKMGDFTNSLTGAVIGNAQSEITFIPITLKKYWKRFEMVGGKRQFRGTEPFTEMNANRPLEEEAPSQANRQVMAKWSYDLTIDMFGFTEDDVQDPIALPTAVSFTRTSYKAGQKVNTHFASLDGALPHPIPYPTYMLSISAQKKQNDKGIFYVFDVKPKMEGAKAAKTPKEYFPKVERWAQILNDGSKNVVVDDSDEAASEASAPVDESRF